MAGRYDIKIGHGDQTSILVVDSAYRDRATDSPNNYTVKLINKYSNATSIELVYASVPNSNYNITDTCNLLHIMSTGNMTVISGISGGTRTGFTGTADYSFSSLVAVGRPEAGPFVNDNTFRITHSNGTVSSISIIAGGANWHPGETITIPSTSFTPQLNAALTFTVVETDISVVTVPPGLYTDTTLINVLNDVGDIVPNTILTYAITSQANATVNRPIGTLTITSDNTDYQIAVKVVDSPGVFTSGTMARILGFKPINKYNTNAIVQSDYPVMLEMDNYITMFIEGMERCDGIHTGVHGAFCVIPLNALHENFGLVKDSNDINKDKFTYYFNQPRKLSDLHISFRDWEGNLYDFNGQEHLLVFKITSRS